MLVPPLTILLSYCVFFFFNDTATTEIYTLSLHDALPIYRADRGGGRARREQRGGGAAPRPERPGARRRGGRVPRGAGRDRRGERERTPLKTPHPFISYCVFFFLKKKKKTEQDETRLALRN